MKVVQPIATEDAQAKSLTTIMNGLADTAAGYVKMEMLHSVTDKECAALAAIAVTIARDAFDAVSDLAKSGNEIDIQDALGLYERAMDAIGHIQSAIGVLSGSNA